METNRSRSAEDSTRTLEPSSATLTRLAAFLKAFDVGDEEIGFLLFLRTLRRRLTDRLERTFSRGYGGDINGGFVIKRRGDGDGGRGVLGLAGKTLRRIEDH